MPVAKTITLTVSIRITISTTTMETPSTETITTRTFLCQIQTQDIRTPDILIIKQTHKIKDKGNETLTTTATHDQKITHAAITKSVRGYELKFNFKPFRLSFTQKTYQ